MSLRINIQQQRLVTDWLRLVLIHMQIHKLLDRIKLVSICSIVVDYNWIGGLYFCVGPFAHDGVA